MNTNGQSPPPDTTGGGAAVLRATIIASTCNDEGACIMCADCGHVFADSKPFTDESVGRVNTELARELWYHMCAMGRRPERKVKSRGRIV